MSTSSQSILAIARTVSSVERTRSFAHFQRCLDSGSVQSVLLHRQSSNRSSCKGPWQSPSVNSPCHIEQSQRPANLKHKSTQFGYSILLNATFRRQHNRHCIASLHVSRIQDRPFCKIILRRQKGEVNLGHWLPIILLHGMTLSSLRLDTVFTPVSKREMSQFMQSPFTLRWFTLESSTFSASRHSCHQSAVPAVGRSRGTNNVYPVHL